MAEKPATSGLNALDWVVIVAATVAIVCGLVAVINGTETKTDSEG